MVGAISVCAMAQEKSGNHPWADGVPREAPLDRGNAAACRHMDRVGKESRPLVMSLAREDQRRGEAQEDDFIGDAGKAGGR